MPQRTGVWYNTSTIFCIWETTMLRKIHKSALLFLFTGVLVFSCILPALAEKTTEQKLAETNEAIEQLQKKSKEAKEKLDAAKQEQSAIGQKLDELNSQLEEVQQALEDVEARITKKNEQVAATEKELADMEKLRTERYEAMKVRIRFMYENSDSSMLDLFLGAHSMSELLNRVEYFSQVVEYDRGQLKEYQDLLTGLEEKKQLYEGQKEELVALRQEQQEQIEQLTVLVADARNDLKDASAGTKDAEDALDDLDEKLRKQEDYQSVLEAQLAYEEQLEAQKAAEDKARMEEIRRQEEELKRKREEEERRRKEEEEKRQEAESGGGTDDGSGESNTDEPPASAEDLELLACIIQCEAEGEPYAGKLAVGSVVMNRVASSSFPNTIMGVIYQPGQFSPVASGRMAARVAAGANSECRQAAQEVLSGNITVPYLYFRRDNGTIDGYVIGHHVFY